MYTKNRKIIALTLAFSLVVSTVSGITIQKTQAEPLTQNFIYTEDFSEATSTNHVQQNGTSTWTLADPPDVQYGQSLRVTTGTQNYDGIAITNAHTNNQMVPGQKYKLTANVQSTTGAALTLQVRVETTESGATKYGTDGTVNVEINKDHWTTVSLEMDIPSTRTNVDKIVFCNANGTENFGFYLDNVVIQQISTPPPITDHIVYDMAEDPALPAIGQTFESTATLERAGNPTLTITDNGGQKAISVTDRTADWHAIDVILSSLNIVPGDEYTFKVHGQTTAGAKAKIMVAASPWTTLDSATADDQGQFALAYKKIYTTADLNDLQNYRIQTESSTVDYKIESLIITSTTGTPEPKPPVTDPIEIFSEGFETENVLDKNGDVTAFERTQSDAASGLYSLKVSPVASNDYSGACIWNTSLSKPMIPGSVYKLTAKVKGTEGKTLNIRVETKDASDNDSWAGGGASSIVLSGTTWKTLEMTMPIPVTHSSVNKIVFHNGGHVQDFTFYLDDIKIELISGPIEVVTELFFPFDDKTEEDKKGIFSTTSDRSAIDYVSQAGIGYESDTALKVTKAKTNAEGYNSAENAVRLTLKNPLPAGKSYEIVAYFYAPSAGNEGKETLKGPGLVLNGEYGNDHFKLPPNVSVGTLPLDTWKEVRITTPLMDTELKTIDFRLPVNLKSQHADIWYMDNVRIKQLQSELPRWDLTLDALKDTYKDDFIFGNILEPNQLENPETVAMYTHFYNAVTAENAMKPQSIAPTKDTYNFARTDTLVQWATENNIAVHGHTLVWHAQSPAWLNKDAQNKPLTRAEAKENMKTYIDQVAGHYKGQLLSWDVVNEALLTSVPTLESGQSWKDVMRTTNNADTNPGEASFWYGAYANGADASKGESGADYIYDAFVFARLADRDAKLYYNDFNETQTGKREAISLMVEELNHQWKTDPRNTEPNRLLIEGIGMQSHYWLDELDANGIQNVDLTIARFIKTGADVSITELDIPTDTYRIWSQGNSAPFTKELSQHQAQKYAELFLIYRKYADHIDRVTIWGKADPQSWRSKGNPLLFDERNQPKESFIAVVDPLAYLHLTPLTVDGEDTVTAGNSTTYTANGENLFFSVNNAKIATIDTSGVLQALEEGIVIVTATSYDKDGNITNQGRQNVRIVKARDPEPTPNTTNRSSRRNSFEVAEEQEQRQQTENPKATVGANGTIYTTLTPEKDSSKIHVSHEIIQTLLDQPNMDDPNHTVGVVINNPTDTLEMTLSEQDLALLASQVASFEIRSHAGTLMMSQKLLADFKTGSTHTITLTIQRPDTTSLKKEVKDRLNDSLVYDITIQRDNNEIRQFSGNLTFTVSYPMDHEKNPDFVVAFHVTDDLLYPVYTKYDRTTQTVSFVTNHLSTYAICYHPVSFQDIKYGHLNKTAIEYIVARDITVGITEKTFEPDVLLTRGMFAVMIMRAYGIEPETNIHDNFVDAGDTYYTGYLAKAKALHLLAGVGNNQFQPEKVLSTQEMYTMLYRFAKYMDLLPLVDDTITVSYTLPDWSKESITTLIKAGVCAPDDHDIVTNPSVTCGKAAIALYRILQ